MRRVWLAIALLASGCAGGAGRAAFAQSCVTASQVTLTGTLRASNGLPSANDAILLTPSQVGLVVGCGVNTAATTSCATSADGSVVQTGNPLSGAVLSTTSTGTLPSGTYYVVFAWYDALGHVTLVSPETVQQLSVQGTLVVTPPASGVPSTAAGMQVYIGTSSGGETLQGSTTGGASYTQSTALASGAAVPTANTTVCVAVANDTIWPVGTGYIVNLVSPQGSWLPGYPMEWQLLGPGTTINLSNGLPYYHGVVFYPTPILSAPQGHATQSISGSLSLGGYNLLDAGKIGVGTSLPAWPIDVENGAINASGGFILNGGSGVSTGYCLSAGSDAFHTFDAAVPCLGSAFYQTVQSVGTGVAQQPVLNFDATMSVTPQTGKTTVGLAMVGTAGTYTYPTSVTTDAWGRVTSITSGGAGCISYTNYNGQTSVRNGGTAYHNTTGCVMDATGALGTTTAGSTGTVYCQIGPTSSTLTTAFENSAGATPPSSEYAFVCAGIPPGYWYKAYADGAISNNQVAWAESTHN